MQPKQKNIESNLFLYININACRQYKSCIFYKKELVQTARAENTLKLNDFVDWAEANKDKLGFCLPRGFPLMTSLLDLDASGQELFVKWHKRMSSSHAF